MLTRCQPLVGHQVIEDRVQALESSLAAVTEQSSSTYLRLNQPYGCDICIINYFFSLTDTAASASAILLQRTCG
jgi:hypothetical protein